MLVHETLVGFFVLRFFFGGKLSACKSRSPVFSLPVEARLLTKREGNVVLWQRSAWIWWGGGVQ